MARFIVCSVVTTLCKSLCFATWLGARREENNRNNLYPLITSSSLPTSVLAVVSWIGGSQYDVFMKSMQECKRVRQTVRLSKTAPELQLVMSVVLNVDKLLKRCWKSNTQPSSKRPALFPTLGRRMGHSNMSHREVWNPPQRKIRVQSWNYTFCEPTHNNTQHSLKLWTLSGRCTQHCPTMEELSWPSIRIWRGQIQRSSKHQNQNPENQIQ